MSHETVRYWWNRFGPMFASEITRKRVQQLRAFTKWKCHVGEVFVKVNGKRHYLWRAVDHEGELVEAVVTKTPKQEGGIEIPQEVNEGTRQSGKRRHGSLRIASGRSQRVWCYQKTADGQVAQQSRREFAPSFATTRTRLETFQAHTKFTETRLRPFLLLQPLQPGKIACQPRYLQADTHRLSRRVARTWCGIKSCYIGLAETGSNLSDSTFEEYP